MRITGGRWRSRALAAPRGTATRPTSDRVREALFSTLTSDGVFDLEPREPREGEDGPRVLDLYAGSGALAFEALSRGASQAVLVEHAREAIAAIRENARALQAEELVHVFPTRVDRATSKIEGPFELVFVDPPYMDVRAAGFVEILAGAANLVARGATLVLEHASKDPPPAVPGLDLHRSRRYGDTTLTFYRARNPVTER